MSEKEILPAASQSLEKYFDDAIQFSEREKILEWLTDKIIYMLLHKMEKLLEILYRIDVNEKKVKEVFAQNEPKKIAPLLAELILEREIQKAESRMKYKKKE